MSSEHSIKLKCQQCGHEWTSRNTDGKGRQCSKCRSRKMIEMPKDSEPVTNVPDGKVIASRDAADMLTDLRNDSEVREKLKELELARLDRQIREVRGNQLSDGLAERLAIKLMDLLVELSNARAIDEDVFERLISYCPWCEANGEDGLIYEDPNEDHPSKNGYRCNSCGHWVPY